MEADDKLQMSAENQRMLRVMAHDSACVSAGGVLGRTTGWVALTNGVLVVKLLSC